MLNEIIEKLVNSLKKMQIFSSLTKYRIQTFTYYIPAPPPRKTGYREKEFDKLFSSILRKGYKILTINTQSHSGPEGAGLWVLVTLKEPLAFKLEQKKADPLNVELELPQAEDRINEGNEPPIKGLYYETEYSLLRDDIPFKKDLSENPKK